MEGHLYKPKIVEALKWTLGGHHASIFPNQKLNYELNWVILFLPSVFYLLNKTWKIIKKKQVKQITNWEFSH